MDNTLGQLLSEIYRLTHAEVKLREEVERLTRERDEAMTERDKLQKLISEAK